MAFADDTISPRRQRRRSFGFILYWIGGFVSAVLIGQVIFAGMTEGYCFIWPSIGTRFASDFTHAGFDRIQPGMTKEDVMARLGSPLGISDVRRLMPRGMDDERRLGDETWQYANDSSALGGDWAWLSREVVFRQGKVHHTFRWVFYD